MPYIDERQNVNVVCDVCKCTVNIQSGEFIYVEEFDISYFECYACLRDEGSI